MNVLINSLIINCPFSSSWKIFVSIQTQIKGKLGTLQNKNPLLILARSAGII